MDICNAEIIRIEALSDSQLQEAIAQHSPRLADADLGKDHIKEHLLDMWQQSQDLEHGPLLQAPESSPLESMIAAIYSESCHYEAALQTETNSNLDPHGSGGGKALTTEDLVTHTVHGYDKLHETWLANKESLMAEGILAVHPPCENITAFISAVDNACTAPG